MGGTVGEVTAVAVVYVATFGMDYEGDDIIGAADSEDTAKRLCEAHDRERRQDDATPLEWAGVAGVGVYARVWDLYTYQVQRVEVAS